MDTFTCCKCKLRIKRDYWLWAYIDVAHNKKSECRVCYTNRKLCDTCHQVEVEWGDCYDCYTQRMKKRLDDMPCML